MPKIRTRGRAEVRQPLGLIRIVGDTDCAQRRPSNHQEAPSALATISTVLRESRSTGSNDASSANGTRGLRFVSIGAEGAARGEVAIALDGESERPAQRQEFRESDVTKLGAAEAQVTQAKGEIGVGGIELSEEPRRVRIRRKELYDGARIAFIAAGGGRTVVD